MTSHRIEPAKCRTMIEVRQGIDRIDEEIVTLLGERFRYMDAAARIKQERATVRDEVRKAQVIAHAKRRAAIEDIPVDVVADLYERLVEGSIAYEFEQYDAGRVNASLD